VNLETSLAKQALHWQSKWAEREQSQLIAPLGSSLFLWAPLSAPFPLSGSPLRALLTLHWTSLCSTQADFRPAPLRFPLRSRSGHMICAR